MNGEWVKCRIQERASFAISWEEFVDTKACRKAALARLEKGTVSPSTVALALELAPNGRERTAAAKLCARALRASFGPDVWKLHYSEFLDELGLRK